MTTMLAHHCSYVEKSHSRNCRKCRRSDSSSRAACFMMKEKGEGSLCARFHKTLDGQRTRADIRRKIVLEEDVRLFPTSFLDALGPYSDGRLIVIQAMQTHITPRRCRLHR